MASYRDCQAARLHRQRWTYARIAEHLGYPDRRAAHRGVLRGLAEPAAEEAQLRALRAWETDEQLLDVQRRLWDVMERHQPYSGTTRADAWAYLRIIDALLGVSLQRCRLHGLFVHPWRCDQWWRRDVPIEVWFPLQQQADHLGREARIPLRWRPPAGAGWELAPVVPLRPVPVPLVDVDSLVSPAVRRLLEAG